MTKMKPFKIIYLIIKLIITVISSYLMLFAISFNMVSKEQLLKLVVENFWSFFFTKFLIGLIIGFIFFIISLIVNVIFAKKHEMKKQVVYKLGLIEFLYFIIFSGTFTYFVIKCI